jgi:hypothetical protein
VPTCYIAPAGLHQTQITTYLADLRCCLASLPSCCILGQQTKQQLCCFNCILGRKNLQKHSNILGSRNTSLASPGAGQHPLAAPLPSLLVFCFFCYFSTSVCAVLPCSSTLPSSRNRAGANARPCSCQCDIDHPEMSCFIRCSAVDGNGFEHRCGVGTAQRQ